MTLTEAVATQPLWVNIWVTFLAAVMFIVPLFLLVFKLSRRHGIIILGVNIAAAVLMNLAYAEVGLTRILGAVHIVLWVPLLIWLLKRPRADWDWPRAPQRALVLFMIVITISLAFDIVDVARYALGDRDSMIPPFSQAF